MSLSRFEPGTYGRNSHIIACTECRVRKSKCSKGQPACFQCKRANRKCVYPPSVKRTPLTRQYLTEVETRAQMLEMALDRLLPTGEVDSVLRLVLNGDLPETEVRNAQFSAEEMQQSVEFPLNSTTDETSSYTAMKPQPDAIDNGVGSFHESIGSDEVDLGIDEKHLTDHYFRTYHTMHPFVHEASFRVEQQTPEMQTSPGWPILANMILTFGAWMSQEGPPEAYARYYARAKSDLQQLPMFTRGDLTMVQALMLLSDFAQRQGSPDESEQYLGTGIQMAINLNLFQEPVQSETSLTLLTQEIRRRLWWSVYCFGSCSAKIYGRPLLLPEDGLITTRFPSNINDSDLIHSPSSWPAESGGPTIYSGLIEQSSYHRMANSLYRTIIVSSAITSQDIHDLRDQIDEWRTSSPYCMQQSNLNPLPYWYTASRTRQMLCDRSLRLLIQRPLLLRWLKMKRHASSETTVEDPSKERQCRLEGLQVARTTIQIIADLITNRQYSVLTLPFILYSLFHALIVPAIHLKADPSSLESISCLQDLAAVQQLLPHIPKDRDALASSFVVVLVRLCSFASQPEPDARNEQSSPATGSLHDLQLPSNNIFGNEELKLLETAAFKELTNINFSEWLQYDSNSAPSAAMG